MAVTDDGHGCVAGELVALLRDAGADAVRWDEAVHGAPGAVAASGIGGVVFLGGLRADGDDVEVAREAFRTARALAGRGSFVTVGRLGRAGPGALARTCAREWPDAAVRVIEVEYKDTDIERVAAAVAAELLTGDTEADVVVRADGSRAGWRMRPSPLPPARPAGVLGPESVVVITGGGRGVTAACARALADAFHPRIALIGRTPLTDDPPELRAARTEADLRAALLAQAVRGGGRPKFAAIEAELRRVLAVREVRATLADIASSGSAVRYLAADVGDSGSLRAALREVRAEWGAITGIVHGAGVLADRLVADKTDEQFDLVTRVKVQGLRNLLELVGEEDEPTLLCVFSSVVVSAGNAGQCDYAAANEIIERMALDWRERHPECLVKAIAWGPWRGGMVGPELAEAFGERDIPLIAPAGGAAAFVAEITGPRDQVRSLITAGGDAGASLGGDRGRATRGGEIEVSEVSQVWLADHRVGGQAGRAVVPLAVALDWMVRLTDPPSGRRREDGGRGAPQDRGTDTTVTLREVDVMHGIIAPAVVTVRRNGSALTVETGGHRCYRASLAATDAPEPQVPPWAGPGVPQDGLRPLHCDPVYDGETLFHGPSLQVIRRIEGVGPAGAVGEVAGTREMGWPDEPWRIDPGALDGAIQLAVVWARERLGRATLPMYVREARLRAAGLEAGRLRCLVRAVSVAEQRAVCDVLLARPDGSAVVAALDGLELVVRPR